MPSVEPRRRVDGAERAGGENHDEPEHAVHDRHGRAVGGTEPEAATARSGLRAGADDGQIDRNHRQDARRQVQRQTSEEHQKQNRQRSAALEHALLLHAAFGIPDELQEVGRAQVAAGRAEDRKPVQRRDGIATGRGGSRGRRVRASAGRHRRRGAEGRRCRRARFLTVAKGNGLEHVRMECLDDGAGGDDRDGPRGLRRDRDVAHRLVTGLVSKAGRDDEIALRGVAGDGHGDADGEIVFEDAEWLVGSALLQVRRCRKDQLRDGHAFGRRHRQTDGNK